MEINEELIRALRADVSTRSRHILLGSKGIQIGVGQELNNEPSFIQIISFDLN